MTPGTRGMDPAGLPTSLGEAVSSLVTQHLTPTQEIPTCVFLRDTETQEKVEEKEEVSVLLEVGRQYLRGPRAKPAPQASATPVFI